MLLRYRELHAAANPPNGRPMAVRRIRQLGDPILRVRCERVQNPKSAATRLVADDLRDSLARSEEHTSELQSRLHLVCRLLLEKKKKRKQTKNVHVVRD